MTRRVAHRRAGMSLLEILVSTVVVVMVFNVAASLFVQSGRIAAVSTLALDRLHGVQEAQSLFLETVRGAQGVADAAAGFETGPDRIVLSTRAGVTVFGRMGTSDRLGVIRLIQRDGKWESDYVRPLHQRFSEMGFRITDQGLAEMSLMVWRDPEERGGNPMRYVSRAGCRGRTAGDES